jgi:hypothetical protein
MSEYTIGITYCVLELLTIHSPMVRSEISTKCVKQSLWRCDTLVVELVIKGETNTLQQTLEPTFNNQTAMTLQSWQLRTESLLVYGTYREKTKLKSISFQLL